MATITSGNNIAISAIKLHSQSVIQYHPYVTFCSIMWRARVDLWNKTDVTNYTVARLIRQIFFETFLYLPYLYFAIHMILKFIY